MVKAILTASLLTIVAGAYYFYAPLFKPFPTPTGPFKVGTFNAESFDPIRKEEYAENPEQPRRIVVRYFYPAKNDADHKEHYQFLGNKMPYFQEHIAATYHLPSAIARALLKDIPTHSFISAPITAENSPYPVILFSHGGLGYPSDMYIAILENLASHGYIVAAIDHTYFNGLTILSDGSVITEKKLSTQFNALSPHDQKIFLTHLIETYKSDMKLAIDILHMLNDCPKSMLYHHIDFDRIGVMGHSAGGTAAIEFCRADARCKAAVDLDGWYDHVIGQEPLSQPLLLLFAEKSLEVGEPTQEYLKRKELTREGYFAREKSIDEHRKKLCSATNCAMIVIPGATHSDFDNMMFLKWPFRSWNAVDPYKTIGTINTDILNFFQKHLK